MKIGIDIDGVLTDMESFQLDYGSKYFYEKFNKKIVNANSYEVKDIFNVSKQDDDRFWDELFLDYATKCKPRAFASEITKKIHDEGNEIYIITARYLPDNEHKNGKKISDVVKTWLYDNKIYYDEVIISPEDKYEICLKNNIDIMIEDNKNNIEKLSKKIPVICYDARYNKDCIGENIYRCYSFYDLYFKYKLIKDKLNK